MTEKAIFEGLVFDEHDQPVPVVHIGQEASYVIDDAGFMRHIPAEQVDQQVLKLIQDSISGHEDLITDQTAKMLGQDDIFSRAMIESQLKNIDHQFGALSSIGIPSEMRAYMGMMGFRIRINIHGEVIEMEQPGRVADEGEEE